MSLVQEALRRKRGEDQGLSVPAAAAVPEPQLEAPPAAGAPSGLVQGLRIACYVVIVLGALAGLYSLFRPSATEVVREVVVPPSPEAEVVATPSVEPVPTQPVAPEPVVEKAPARVAAPKAPGSWPELRVMGVFAQPDPTRSTVVIDGEIEELNAVVQGVQVVEIRANGALLRHGDKEKFVRVGHTTLR